MQQKQMFPSMQQQPPFTNQPNAMQPVNVGVGVNMNEQPKQQVQSTMQTQMNTQQQQQPQQQTQSQQQQQPQTQPTQIPQMPPQNTLRMFPYIYPRQPIMWPPFNQFAMMPQQSMTPLMQQPQLTQPQLVKPQQPPQNATTANEVREMIQEALKEIHKNQGDSSNNSSHEDDLSSLKDEAELDFEKEYSLEEENLKNIWSGFLTKSKKDRISVDFYQIRGNISDHFNSEYSLNISNRATYEEVVKRQNLGIVAISPQNITQCEIFNEYMKYFNEKERVGVIYIKKDFILYLISPCEFSKKFYRNPKKHLLGVLVDANVEPKPYVDMSNLGLPPPVISFAERKVVTNKQKKNDRK